MGKFRAVGSEINYDEKTGYVTVKMSESPMTPHQVFVFALDLLSTLSPVIQRCQELEAR